ncbi:MAG: DinB family protein [Candidatus Latescibacteria bacterium]|jgi:hypothetical protein|nr:DinB family protein [Candidatus Latescibacterota bacterium]
MPSSRESLMAMLSQKLPRLRALSDEFACRRPGPGKWSPKEIIGHLIDSASNNHQRFVRAQFTDNLVFPGYDQIAWVMTQRYNEAPWPDLVDLWFAFNRQIAHVISVMPENQIARERMEHNLHKIAFITVPENQPVTLGYFMDDYVAHLNHHLNQISPGES